MIYPTRAAILVTAAGAPLAFALAIFMPDRWYAGLAWPLAGLLLTLADALAGPGVRAGSAHAVMPTSISVGSRFPISVDVEIAGMAPPKSAQIGLEVSDIVDGADAPLAVPLEQGRGRGVRQLAALRRGAVTIPQIWLRWRGPLGLVWKQRRIASESGASIHPDLEAARERGAQIFQRHALQGLLSQMDNGDGTDFDALVEYQSGMDRRRIDWKQSARHTKLHAKEHHTERNSQIVFAVDAGRQMCEPVAGLPRVDRAVSAMLLSAWVALKLGDRVAISAFDSRPRLVSGFVSGTRGFGEVQKMAARIDYSGDETNYTFALTTLAGQLQRRSMVVLFTEFTDLISAEFLVRGAQRLLRTHLVLVVVLRDEELETIEERRPETPDDITRAVTAGAMLKERLLVLTRLRHLGAHVVESEHDRVGDRLVAAYLDLKRRNQL
ncbi:DUF58 domain-containing protein [Stakelama tenebrarum]|uniref:DUF58 domain-containing protein n=1 Tax=Stakelama tenebrarum TaxID=2711215 RepID=A0A6G6Y6V6_9SPHN|nr:DUF58 domain-containing protein [Sphingosinithalassobacter tenebrarum]QIG80655.1 DUF58 domain-containing protein [Sphingosinithalassobacter tenebrarum]